MFQVLKIQILHTTYYLPTRTAQTQGHCDVLLDLLRNIRYLRGATTTNVDRLYEPQWRREFE